MAKRKKKEEVPPSPPAKNDEVAPPAKVEVKPEVAEVAAEVEIVEPVEPPATVSGGDNFFVLKADELAAPVADDEPEFNVSELVIKEIMIQKSISRDEAIRVLKNPSK